MKSEKGITLVTMVVYSIMMMIVIGIVAAIQANVNKNLANLDTIQGYVPEFNKLSMYMLDETKKENNGIKKVSGDGFAIEFKLGNKYIYTDNSIYKITTDNKKIKICNNVKDCKFQYDIENNKDIVKVNLKVGETTTINQIMEYVMI